MIIEPDLSSQDLTHGELRERSARFEATLSDLGVEALATLTGKSTELMVALLGIWRRGRSRSHCLPRSHLPQGTRRSRTA